MLLCINSETEEKLSSYNAEEVVIRKLSKYRKLICPHCKGLVFYHNGIHKIAHFKHKAICEYHTEPETEEHLIGKIILHKRLKNLYKNSRIELEERIPNTKQIADVMITHPNGDKWVIEFQCSKITAGKWLERHELYKSAGISDVWILGRYNFCYDKFSSLQMTINSHQSYIALLDIDEVEENEYLESGKLFVSNTNQNINVDSLMIKKDSSNGLYGFSDIEYHKNSIVKYETLKEKLTEHFKKVYKKLQIENDYIIEGTQFKADIMLISPTGEKVAICLEQYFNNPYNWLIKKKKLDGLKMFTFYFYINMDLDKDNLLHQLIKKDNRYYYGYDTKLNNIINYKLESYIPLSNLRIMDNINFFELVSNESRKYRKLDYNKKIVIYKRRVCPKCNSKMRIVNHDGIPLYKCSNDKCCYDFRLKTIMCPMCDNKMKIAYRDEKCIWECSHTPLCNYMVIIKFEE